MGFSEASSLVGPSSDCSRGFGPDCRPLLNICMATNVTADQILAVLLAYARSHAAQWHESVARHFYLAMVGAFPCKGSAQ